MYMNNKNNIIIILLTFFVFGIFFYPNNQSCRCNKKIKINNKMSKLPEWVINLKKKNNEIFTNIRKQKRQKRR